MCNIMIKMNYMLNVIDGDQSKLNKNVSVHEVIAKAKTHTSHEKDEFTILLQRYFF